MTDLIKTISAIKPVFMEFYATADVKSQRMMAIVDELRQLRSNVAKIIQIDGGESVTLGNIYRVSKFPTWLLFKNGREVWRATGERQLNELKLAIDCHV